MTAGPSVLRTDERAGSRARRLDAEQRWSHRILAADLASGLRNTRLVLLEGESSAPYLGDSETVAGLIDEFLISCAQEIGPGSSKPAAQSPRPLAERPDGLTGREAEVLRLVASGLTNIEIAEELVLSVSTVERHIEKIYGKIDARGRAQATAYALTRGLV